MVPAALLFDGVPTLDYAPQTWAALLYLALLASALAYILFYRTLQIAGAGNLSLVTLLIDGARQRMRLAGMSEEQVLLAP